MSIRQLARSLRGNNQGSIAVEGLIMLPILIWCFAGAHIFFEAFRVQSNNLRAAYTITDALTRENGYVTPEYLDSVYDLQSFLTPDGEGSQLRISVVRYNAGDDSYSIRWSQGRSVQPMTDAELQNLQPHLPIRADDEIAILVESWIDWTPGFEVGLDPFTFYDLAVAPPRFAGQLCWNSLNNGGESTRTC